MPEKPLVIVPGKWTTADGRKIEYKDLTNAHLKNIIKDGYRNPHIRKEAAKRGIKVPDRPVDKLTVPELMMWIESFASVALSGNAFAQQMTKLWNDGHPDPSFYLNLNKFLIANAERAKARPKKKAPKKSAAKKKKK